MTGYDHWERKGSFDDLNKAIDQMADDVAERHEREARASEAQIAMREEVVDLHRRLQEESDSRQEQYRVGQEQAARQRRAEWWRWGVATGFAGVALAVSVGSCVQGGAG